MSVVKRTPAQLCASFEVEAKRTTDWAGSDAYRGNTSVGEERKRRPFLCIFRLFGASWIILLQIETEYIESSLSTECFCPGYWLSCAFRRQVLYLWERNRYRLWSDDHFILWLQYLNNLHLQRIVTPGYSWVHPQLPRRPKVASRKEVVLDHHQLVWLVRYVCSVWDGTNC